MKYFWGLIIVLAGVTAAMFVLPTRDAATVEPTGTAVTAADAGEEAVVGNEAVEPPAASEPVAVDEPVAVPEPMAVPETAPGAEGSGAAAFEPGIAAAEAGPDVAAAEAEPAEVAAVELPAPVRPAVDPVTSEVTLSPAALDWLKSTFGEPNPIAQDELRRKTERPDADIAVQESNRAIERRLAADDAAKTATEAAPKEPLDEVAVQPDGSLLIGGRWAISGQGTEASPFVLDWRVLQSASQIYRPRLGEEALPDWAEAINGKRVKLTGYAMLPAGGGNARELLIMLNEWDGCCIGVPPTPYDAAEVKLASSLRPSAAGTVGHQGSSAYGDVVGTMKIDPYIVRGWLLGLYVIEDALFVPLVGN